MVDTTWEIHKTGVMAERDDKTFELLQGIDSPTDLKKLEQNQLPQLAGEIRRFIIETLSHTGGHLSSSLGTVELSLALHYVFDFLKDRIVWDVGHQAYAHKILTGRRRNFATLRRFGGISGFLKPSESPYDHFGAGHASTSISAALGMAAARDQLKQDHQVLAVIGDGSMTGGMAFEGLNQAGYLKKKMIVVLNDNEMSISPNVGALSGYLNQIISGQLFARTKDRVQQAIRMIPGIGEGIAKRAHQLEHIIKTMLVPGFLFQELGFHYVGPINGHNLDQLIKTFRQYQHVDKPVLIHVRTVKGKGYRLAETMAESYHGVSEGFLARARQVVKKNAAEEKPEAPSFTQAFGTGLLKLGASDDRIVAITAAMPTGTGVDGFRKTYPDRSFDVGIAEGHAVTFAAGLATRGLKPVVAIYSTFLQRAYDQIMHDVCLQNLDVTLCLDRAGLVGADGPTHHGVLDIAYLRSLPGMSIMAPRDVNELQHMLCTAIHHEGPVAVRYPRGKGREVRQDESPKPLPFGKGEVLKQGHDMLLVGLGPLVYHLLDAAQALARQTGLQACVVDAKFAKPLDIDLILAHLPQRGPVVTIEDGCLSGGFGSHLLEMLNTAGIFVPVHRLGIPDEFVTHGDPASLYRSLGLDQDSITAKLKVLAHSG